MFIGHDAIGLASKPLARRTSLGWLIAAPLLLDLLWPIFLLLGIEHVRIQPHAMKMCPFVFIDYPWSHSLAMAAVWGLLFGGIYAIATRYVRGGVVLFFGVISHWVCDWLVHARDLPLYPGGPKFGLGLWNHPIAAMAIESALFAFGILVYRDVTEPQDGIGAYGMWVFFVFLGVLYVLNASATPPPSVKALAYGSLALWLLPLWAAWFDRHRMPSE